MKYDASISMMTQGGYIKSNVSAVWYIKSTPMPVMQSIDLLFERYPRTRIKLIYGDPRTGRGYATTEGYLKKPEVYPDFPILLRDCRSTEGATVDTSKIVGIRYANRKLGGWFYRHPFYRGEL